MRLPAAQTSASAVRAGPPSRIPPTTESPLPLRPLSHRAGPLTNRETMPTAATKEVSTESTHTQTAAAPPGSSPGLGETPATQQCLQRMDRNCAEQTERPSNSPWHPSQQHRSRPWRPAQRPLPSKKTKRGDADGKTNEPLTRKTY